MTDTDTGVHEGGCLCGAVRYRCTGAPLWVAHCHCESCRRATGGAVVTWAGFARDRVTFTAGWPQRFASSPGVTRSFCSHCGTPLTYEAERCADEVHFAIGTFDRPEALPPTSHVFDAERISWLHLADDLPRYAGLGRDNTKDEPSSG